MFLVERVNYNLLYWCLAVFGKLLFKPKVSLIPGPTPLEYLDRLSIDFEVDIFVKRDDVMPLAFGGNKVRKLEYIFGEIKGRDVDTVITTGAFHSNHARLTAAASAKLGYRCILVLYPPGGHDIQGNLLLDKLLNAEIVAIDRDEDAYRKMEEVAEKVREDGGKPYIIPGGGASPPGVYGYVDALYEILTQLKALDRKPTYIIHATGTGATQAGLILGLKLLGIEDIKVIGVSVGSPAKVMKKRVAKHVNSSAETLGLNLNYKAEEVIIYDEYTFGGYAEITKDVVDTIREAASKYGLILDPVYTAKAFYAVKDLIKKGEIEKGSTTVFIHTGGTPINFQYNHILKKHM